MIITLQFHEKELLTFKWPVFTYVNACTRIASRHSFYVFKQQGNLLLFKDIVHNTVLFFRKCNIRYCLIFFLFIHLFFLNHALIPNTLPGHLKVKKQVFRYGALVILVDRYRCLRATCCLYVGLKWVGWQWSRVR